MQRGKACTRYSEKMSKTTLRRLATRAPLQLSLLASAAVRARARASAFHAHVLAWTKTYPNYTKLQLLLRQQWFVAGLLQSAAVRLHTCRCRLGSSVGESSQSNMRINIFARSIVIPWIIHGHTSQDPVAS